MNPKKQIKKLINKYNSKGRVLVTGGMGYIGSHTVVELIDAGYEVFIVDNLCNSNLDVLNGIEAITGVRPIFENIDCTDYVMLDKFFRKYDNIQTVIHFAALKAVGESTQNPLPYYRNNLMSLVNLLELMAAYNVNNLVFSSSCTVYGQPDKLPVTEEAPRQKALSPYGNTKQICEDMIIDAVSANREIKSIMLRYFNPIGAHPSALIGELPNGVPNNLLPYVAQTAAGIRKKLQVFGDDYNTPDGSCIRDYINIVDLAKAHVSALKRLNEDKVEGIETFNIGSGKGLSVLELIDAFENYNEVKVPFEIVGRREGDIEQVWADPKLANDILKWKAKASLEETVKSIWKWQLHLVEDNTENTKKIHYGSLLKGSS